MRRSSFAILIFAVIVSGSLVISGCSAKKESKQSEESLGQAEQSARPEMPKAPKFFGTVAGITWNFPNTWVVAPQKPMRSATYIISPTQGDTDSAECAVYYFGATSGGAKQANLERWASQFEQPDGGSSMERAKFDEKTINGLPVSTIDLSGTYLVSSGPMMQVSGKKEGYRLLGAIVDGPQGSIFFKLTGPTKTVTASETDFKELVESLKPQTM